MAVVKWSTIRLTSVWHVRSVERSAVARPAFPVPTCALTWDNVTSLGQYERHNHSYEVSHFLHLLQQALDLTGMACGTGSDPGFAAGQW